MRTLTNRGFTLLEVMVAMVMLTMLASMVYSVLHAGIGLAEKGDDRLVELQRQQGLVALLQRQVRSSQYLETTKKINILADGGLLKIITDSSVFFPEGGLVLAVYRYDRAGDRIYYLEKRDYYNVDYGDDYVPDFSEMMVLLEDSGEIDFIYDEDEEILRLQYQDQKIEFKPWCG